MLTLLVLWQRVIVAAQLFGEKWLGLADDVGQSYGLPGISMEGVW
jgi:hypothetical protein